MAKDTPYFLTWQIFVAIVSVNRASQQHNASNLASEIETCPKGCFCSPCSLLDIPDSLAVHCSGNLTHEDLDMAGVKNLKICSLDLSRNNIENISFALFKNASAAQNLTLSRNLIEVIPGNIFVNLKSLKFLFLEYNKIQIITEDTFNGLEKLEYLNLAHNNLRKWYGTLSKDLPKLQFLNIMENYKFKIKASKDKLLVDTALRTILGITTTSKGCVQCNYSRVKVPLEILIQLKGCEYIPSYNMPAIYEFQTKYWYYEGTCSANVNKSCTIALIPMHKVRKKYRSFCWDRGRSLRPVEYFLGIVALLFNFVVIATILCNRHLITKTSMYLTAQLAFGDLFLAVFSLTIANGHGIMTDPGIRQWREHQCPYFRSLLIIGQTFEAFTSVVMTLERYLVIVYCMRPNLRISLRQSCFLSVFTCIFASFACFAIQYFDAPIIRDNFMCVLVQNFQTSKRILASQVLMLLFVGVYFTVIGMYIHIYFSVRKSEQSAGIKRETSLAKRISIIVFSNMLLYAVPNLSIVIYSTGNLNLLSDKEINFVLRLWLPPVCMIANACLNPFLFAFRNEQFLTSLRQVAQKIFSPVCPVEKPPFGKPFNQVGLYVVNSGESGQNSSQLTLNESL